MSYENSKQSRTHTLAHDYLNPVHSKHASSVKSIKQAKLKIGASNDRYEQEADHVADQVMWMPDIATVQRKLSSDNLQTSYNKKSLVQAQTTAISGANGTEYNAPSSVNQALASSSRPLDQTTQSFFESRFSQDLSAVRVHNKTPSSNAAGEINARAFTVASLAIPRWEVSGAQGVSC